MEDVIDSKAVLVFADIVNMCPSVKMDEEIREIKKKYALDPSDTGLTANSVANALKIAQDCNCIKFKDNFYLPKDGGAMGPAYGCDVTDLWIGNIIKTR